MLSFRKNKQIYRIVGVLIFVYILFSIDLNAILHTLYHANLKYILLASLLIIVVTILKSLRWQLLLRVQGIDYSLRDCFIMYYIALYIGTVTPGRVGEFTKVLFLKKDGHSMSKSMFSVFMDRIFDIVLLSVASFVSIFAFITFFDNIDIFSLIINLLLIFAILFILINKMFILSIIKFAHVIPYFKKYAEFLEKQMIEFIQEFEKLNLHNIVLTFVITIIAWIIYYVLVYSLALAIDIKISFLYLIACISFSAIITLLPISISGIGTRDAILIFLFSKVGLSGESAVAFSIMILGVYVFNGVIGFFAWMKYPIEL